MARHHVYLRNDLEDRIKRLKGVIPVNLSALLNMGVELVLDRMEAPPAPAPAPTPVATVAEAPAAPQEAPRALGARIFQDGNSFSVLDLCVVMRVDMDEALAELPNATTKIDHMVMTDMDGLRTICSMSHDFDMVDQVHNWIQNNYRD